MTTRYTHDRWKIGWLSPRSYQLSPSLSYQRVHRCFVHGYYADGLYCDACEEDPDRPHDVWGDKTIRFVVSR